ncbi:hypothetical protein [Geobacter sp. DSM 9736]|uniref:hypothetical protein n=1 Tax=Geobacter sp. DSM 9736 TaxID=1277350 RepID=UPI000B5058E3|nr:hypothetical protein [Geobacter sp. DSM 9736]SNB44811.1 hypothetical protein SAMN06269301_0198 [Geobacter sp. DSM 9736]
MKELIALLALMLVPATASAHHGGVTLAFGPGSPIETSSPLTLPEGAFVTGVRAEQVEWRRVHAPEDKSSFTFLNANFSYGFTPALMGTFIVPYYVKRTEGNGSNAGLSDVKLQFTYGFHHDPATGFSRNTEKDSAMSMESLGDRTWLTVSAMASIPTGDHNEALNDGTLDPGMQTGFGAPSYTLGIAAARAFGPLTMNAELSTDIFTERDNFQFGSEVRGNLAGVYELYGNDNLFVSRVDGILELNYLHLERDRENGVGLEGTGGDILYLSPGIRFSLPSLQNANLGILVKLPVARSLNEEQLQQGAEGLEKFRLITALTLYF